MSIPTSKTSAKPTLPHWIHDTHVEPRWKQRIIELLTALDADPHVPIEVDGLHVHVPRKAITRTAIAHHCGVSSQGTVGEWVNKWRSHGYLNNNTFDLTQLAPHHPTSATHDTQTPSEHIDPLVETMLKHLERAHQQNLDKLCHKLETWIEDLLPTAGNRVNTDTTSQYAAQTNQTAATTPQVVSSSTSKNSTTSYLTTDKNSRDNAEPNPRTRAQLTDLLAPLTELVDKHHLVPMHNSASVEKALQPYTDQEVRAAVAALSKAIRTQGDIKSPFGLLVNAARERNEDLFQLPEPTPKQRQTPSAPTAINSSPVPLKREKALEHIRLAQQDLRPHR